MTTAAPGSDGGQQAVQGQPPELTGQHPYKLSERGISRVVRSRDKQGNVSETETKLTNFAALITGDVAVDDGTEVRREFEITAGVNGRNACFMVPAERFAGMSWVTENLGASAIVRAGMGVKDHARAAIQYLSGDEIAQRHVYAHTGWRQLPGGHGYLTASGAMMAAGLDTSVTVDLGPLAGYALPGVPGVPEVQHAIRASLAILEIAPDQMMVPLLGATYRAPVPLPADCGVWLHGQSGTYKTCLCALCQQHFGEAMDAYALPGNWTSTANSLEMQAFALDSALFVIDDFSPVTSRFEAQKRADAVDRVLRGAANHGARGRLRSDGTMRPPKPARAQVLVSGEDLPPAIGSLRARVMICEAAPGKVNVAKLTAAQAYADDGTLALAMAGYVQHFAYRLGTDPDLRATLRARLWEFRDLARAQGHPRTALDIATLAIGWDQFVTYAERMGAITAAGREELWQRAWKALCDLGADQGRYAREADPAAVYLRALAALVTSGRAHLAAADGGQPAEPGRWGWRLQERVTGNWDAQRGLWGTWEPQGPLLGWAEGESVYLDPEGSHKAAVQFTDAAGEQLGLTKHALHKLIFERGLIASRSDPGHFTAKRDLGGKTGRRVLHLTVRGFDSGTES